MSEESMNIAADWVADAPFPAVLLAQDKTVMVQSRAAETLVKSLGIPSVVELFSKVEQSNTAHMQTAGFETEKGVLFYDLTLCPFGEGYLLSARDSSLEHNLRAALMDSRQRFKDLVDISSDFAWEVGADGYFIFVSQRGAVGYEPDELIRKHCDEIVLKRHKKHSLNPFMSKSKLEREEVWVVRPDGEPACLMVSCVPLFDDNNHWVGARGVCRDITEERERDAALARAYHRDQLLAYIVKTIRDEVEPSNMLTAAANATARALSANGCQIYRCKPDSDMVVNASFGDIPDEIPELFEKLESLGENEVGIFEVKDWLAIYSATRYRRNVNGAICLWREKVRGTWNDDDKILATDVANQLGIANEQISGHERIVELSRTDALTGLLNRRAFFEEELPRHIDRLQYNNKPAALIYVDLDHFKQVNDAFGHQKGDEILLLVRDFLLKQVRPGDVVARLGGDEFALWLDDITENTAHKRCTKMMESSTFLQEHSGADDMMLGVSLGLALYHPDSDESIETLVSRADAAMYEAKKAGKSQFCVAEDYKGQ
ncbi:GGDEF domain-containing protein [Candidatus Terasakiella magnetica]|uniref:GGDEF domain-containing protein n=1 Tax=Candidatus Terasakiella magnetica TaxID=1867952 RepID=A0A1C3RIC1_9PROT|nr:diguanylate cyclase [Candidatus Terasakiella magnetica]SCA57023.1 GGDEF domain-containing protein [Candidatus Terasakiella magnetica]